MVSAGRIEGLIAQVVEEHLRHQGIDRCSLAQERMNADDDQPGEKDCNPLEAALAEEPQDEREFAGDEGAFRPAKENRSREGRMERRLAYAHRQAPPTPSDARNDVAKRATQPPAMTLLIHRQPWL